MVLFHAGYVAQKVFKFFLLAYGSSLFLSFGEFYVCLCSARDWERSGLLEEIPKVVVQISALL